MMTRAEALFWQQVRAGRLRGYKFKRQVPIAPYIVDFLCIAARAIVELDGPPHETTERRIYDVDRDAWLRGQDFTVLRFSNDMVLGNCQLVLDAALAAIEARLGPSPAPLRGAPSPAKGERVIRASRLNRSPTGRRG
jgi:very-short-patch-repair endonuclease